MKSDQGIIFQILSFSQILSWYQTNPILNTTLITHQPSAAGLLSPPNCCLSTDGFVGHHVDRSQQEHRYYFLVSVLSSSVWPSWPFHMPDGSQGWQLRWMGDRNAQLLSRQAKTLLSGWFYSPSCCHWYISSNAWWLVHGKFYAGELGRSIYRPSSSLFHHLLWQCQRSLRRSSSAFLHWERPSQASVAIRNCSLSSNRPHCGRLLWYLEETMGRTPDVCPNSKLYLQ